MPNLNILALIVSAISAFTRTDRQTDMARSTRLVILIKNIYTFVTYFPTNLVYPFSLRVTGIKRCAVPQLSEETLNFSLHHENFQKSRSFLLHDQSDDLISQLSIFENFLSHNQGSLGYKDYIYALRSSFYTRYS